MKKYLKYMLVLLVVLAGLWFLFKKVNIWQPLKNVFSEAPVTIDSTPIIIREIKPLAKLMVITYTDEVVKDTSKPGKGLPSLVPLSAGALLQPSRDKLVLIGRGRVILGTDLKPLNVNDIEINGDSITVFVPKAAILETVINPSSFEVFEEKGNWPEQAVIQVKQRIREEIERRALQQNLLTTAEERSRMILETFLKNFGYREVNVVFRN